MIGKIDRGIKMLGLIAASCGAARSWGARSERKAVLAGIFQNR
jgi:hypothetical protein